MAFALKQQSNATPVRTVKRQGKWKRYSERTFWLFVGPWVAGFLALTLLPLVYALLMSFTNFDGISGRWHWIGLTNYRLAFTDPDTWHSLIQTILYTAVAVPLSIAGGLGLAVLLNQRIRAVGLFRTIFYLPSVVPVVAATIMWKLIFDRDTGALNAIIERLGGPTITWLLDPTAFFALLILVLWGLGGGMVIFLAGLQGIPPELHEAAAIDGATSWQSFRHVTLPLLSNVIFFQVTISVIYGLQTLVQPLLLAPGVGATDVPRSNVFYMVNVYQQFFYNQRFGYGSALIWLLFIVILGITLLVMRTSRLWVFSDAE